MDSNIVGHLVHLPQPQHGGHGVAHLKSKAYIRCVGDDGLSLSAFTAVTGGAVESIRLMKN